MVTTLPLLSLDPKQQKVVWGGNLLHKRLDKPASDEPVGESWEVWEGDPVLNGPFEGETLASLTQRFPHQLLGSVPVSRGWNRFPLLTKFIDAGEPLSVQVHPDDRQAQRLEQQPNGKTEAWYILEARKDAWVIHGLAAPVERDVLRSRLQEGSADALFQKVPVTAGDTVFVPAGTIHAIGPGILLHEVQQTSDTTYRLYDWNRQAQGSKRQLHLDKGLEVSALITSTQPLIEPLEWREGQADVSLLLATPFFTVKRLHLTAIREQTTKGQSFHILSVLDGSCAVITADGLETALENGQSLVVPASQGAYRIRPLPDVMVLCEWIADINHDLIPTLRSYGFEREQIDRYLKQFQSTQVS